MAATKAKRVYLTWIDEMDIALLVVLVEHHKMVIIPKMDESHMCTMFLSIMYVTSVMWTSQRKTYRLGAKL